MWKPTTVGTPAQPCSTRGDGFTVGAQQLVSGVHRVAVAVDRGLTIDPTAERDLAAVCAFDARKPERPLAEQREATRRSRRHH